MKSTCEALTMAASRLAPAIAQDPGASTAKREAELLLCEAAGVSRGTLFAWPDRAVNANQLAAFDALVDRRCAGEPIAYLLGTAPFMDFDLEVTPAVLVPRADTEVLVEQVLSRLVAPARCADLGTGSGAIAIALARAGHEVVATDASEPALAVARRNAARLVAGDPVSPAGSIEFLHGSWLAPLAGRRFAAIVSNPPYIDESDAHLAALAREPREALVAEDAGRADLAAIVDSASARLAPGGWLALEHGAAQGEWLRARLTAAGYAGVETTRDLGGHERATLGQWGSSTVAAQPHGNDGTLNTATGTSDV